MRQSIWERDVEFPSFPKLEGDIKTDVLVIGGGLCGVLCAWFLKQAGVDYVLVEGDAVGRGVTCNTTAKITSQHGLIYEKLLRTQGKRRRFSIWTPTSGLWANTGSWQRKQSVILRKGCLCLYSDRLAENRAGGAGFGDSWLSCGVCAGGKSAF